MVNRIRNDAEVANISNLLTMFVSLDSFLKLIGNDDSSLDCY